MKSDLSRDSSSHLSSADRAEGSEYFSEYLSEIRLLQLADSALPIGTLSHSFGLESLVAAKLLTVGGLRAFLHGYLEEAGKLEAVFCRQAHRLGAGGGALFSAERWRELNDLLSALKPARESRAASASLGQNFLRAVTAMGDFPALRGALSATKPHDRDRNENLVHHSAVFGLACGVLEIGEDRAVLAYLHQAVANLVSACQRLLPLGQTAAAQIQWDLKPAILGIVRQSASSGLDDIACFMPLLDWGAMEHPALLTRLFVS